MQGSHLKLEHTQDVVQLSDLVLLLEILLEKTRELMANRIDPTCKDRRELVDGLMESRSGIYARSHAPVTRAYSRS